MDPNDEKDFTAEDILDDQIIKLKSIEDSSSNSNKKELNLLINDQKICSMSLEKVMQLDKCREWINKTTKENFAFIDKKDDYAFCFSLKNNKIYEAVKGSYSIFFYPGNIFGFFWFIDIKENSLTNGGSDHTPWSQGYYEGITSQFELNGGKEDFHVSEIECYQICS